MWDITEWTTTPSAPFFRGARPTGDPRHDPQGRSPARGADLVRGRRRGTILFTTGADTVKGRTLARTGHASLCVDDDRPPFTFVTIEGTVTLSDDVDASGTGPR